MDWERRLPTAAAAASDTFWWVFFRKIIICILARRMRMRMGRLMRQQHAPVEEDDGLTTGRFNSTQNIEARNGQTCRAFTPLSDVVVVIVDSVKSIKNIKYQTKQAFSLYVLQRGGTHISIFLSDLPASAYEVSEMQPNDCLWCGCCSQCPRILNVEIKFDCI